MISCKSSAYGYNALWLLAHNTHHLGAVTSQQSIPRSTLRWKWISTITRKSGGGGGGRDSSIVLVLFSTPGMSGEEVAVVSVSSLICPENCNLMLNISFLGVLLLLPERLLLIMATFYMRFPSDFHLLYLTLPSLTVGQHRHSLVRCCAMHLLLGFAVPQSTDRLVNQRGMDGWNGGELTSSSADSKWHKQFMHYPILFAGQSTKE